MKLNSLHHARPPMFTRLSDETSSEKNFKYIDVNYAEKVAALTGNHKFDRYSNRSLPGFDFARRNGLFRYGAALPSDGRNICGGLDISLLDTSPSSLNFLTLPKPDASTGLKPMGGNVGVITFNGISLPNYGPKRKCFQAYSKDGLSNLLNSRNRRNKLSHIGQGNYIDKRGVVLSKHGPFWPPGYGPVCKCPEFIEDCKKRESFGPEIDPALKAHTSASTVGRNAVDSRWRQMHGNHTSLNSRGGKVEAKHFISQSSRHQTIGEFYASDSNDTPRRNHYHDRNQHPPSKETKTQWKGKPVIYDCERSSRAPLPHAIPDGMPESLVFESRFESGNLRQVRRIGEYEYELVLRTDMYTKRHTQWYYFRVQNAQRDVKYKINIINLLKKDSLYNYGMKPLVYSEYLASEDNLGWHRRGENISYLPWTNPTRNGLLSLDLQYYNLEFEITFDWENVEQDSIYLAHCYPYTYTDLKRHLDSTMADPDLSRHVKREVLCETTAGNACFLLTITDFPDKEKDKYKDFHQEKKGIVITARVHPGESQASWMMKGVIDFLISDNYKARQLRKNFIIKIVPMLNPDGVIVGNYRTSLAARDLNRNYRHPRQSTFPTIWHTKQMVDSFSQDHEILLYCDLHGHSRKPMVFMYGCERKALYCGSGKQASNTTDPRSSLECAKDFVEERLFPWLMHKRSPEKFSFHGSKYAVRRCKESTGRVVMFRQFGIRNSFTMEASFSGTMRKKLDSGRHFNIEDFLSVGKSLCESILDFHRLSENPLLKSRVIMELTKDLAQHMLETNPQAVHAPPQPEEKVQPEPKSTKLEWVKTNNNKDENQDEKVTVKHRLTLPASGEDGKTKDRLKDPIARNGEVFKPAPQKSFTQAKSTQETETVILGPPVESKASEEVEVMNGDVDDERESKGQELDESCFRLLEQMNFQSIAHESDTSSDSDSESDPELPEESPSSNRQKKKKRKKKQRPGYMKSTSAPSNIGKKPDNKELQKPKAYPGFVNRYTHRSNGGIPIYAQERIQERAARRLAEMKIAEEEKIRRQNEVLLGKLDENGIKDEDARAKYAEVYGIRYQLGPQPNKPQYTLYNPFQDMVPSSGQSEPVRPTQFRVKNEGNISEVQVNHVAADDSSPDIESRETTARSDEDDTKLPQKSAVPLQTLSFRYSGENKDNRSVKSLNRDWMTSSYSERLMSTMKEWEWGSSAYERSRTIDLGANFLRRNGEERVSKIDIGADFNISMERTQKKNKNGVAESSSGNSSASPTPRNGDPFVPKNLTHYEVIIGQMKYPIHVHRSKGSRTDPPAVLGESIMNQKPTEQQKSRAKSADYAKASSSDSASSAERRHCFVNNSSFDDEEDDSATPQAKQYNGHPPDNGLVFAVHRVKVSDPKYKEQNGVGLTREPPLKRNNTFHSPTSRSRTVVHDLHPDFNINSAR